MTETPSSTNITPSHSVELSEPGHMTDSVVIRRHHHNHVNNKNARKLSQRLSCPSNLLLQSETGDTNGGIIRSCRRSVPDMNDNSRGNSCESLISDDSVPSQHRIPDWMRLGESVQVREYSFKEGTKIKCYCFFGSQVDFCIFNSMT